MRVGLAGIGAWARSVHLPALAADARLDLVGLWGRDEDAAARLAAESGCRAFGTLAALIGAVDLLAVAVAPAAQPAIAIEAARAGRHLILEKPVALGATAARSVADALEAGGAHGVVFLSRLWDPARADWLARAAERPWRSARMIWRSAGFRPGAPGVDAWRRDAGPIVDVGPHVISMLEALLGPVSAVVDARECTGRTELRFRHESGAVSSAVLEMQAEVSSTQESIELVGSDGIELWSSHGPVDFIVAYRAMVDSLLSRIGGASSFASPIAALAQVSAAPRAALILDAARVLLTGRNGHA